MNCGCGREMDCDYVQKVVIHLHEPDSYKHIKLQQDEALHVLMNHVRQKCNCGHEGCRKSIYCCLGFWFNRFCTHAENILPLKFRWGISGLDEADRTFLEIHTKFHRYFNEPERCVKRAEEKYNERRVRGDHGDSGWNPAMGRIGNGPAF
jgi:hypothetical protein